MSTLKIYTKETKVADLDLTANVVNSITSDPAMSEIGNQFTEVNQQILNVNNQLTSMQGTLGQVQADIQSCADDIAKLKDDILTLRTDINELSGKTVFHYINNVSFLKPVSEHALHLSVAVYSLSSMDDSSKWNAVFDSAKAEDAEFVEALLINNAANNAETDKTEMSLAGKTVYSSFGSRWIKPVNEGYVFGFGPECNNAPVNLRLYDWLSANADKSKKDYDQFKAFNKGTKLYLRTEWYYTTQDASGQLSYHKSDMYSQVVPTNAEQTADKSYFAEPTAAV